MAIAGLVVSIWIFSGVLAYFATEAAVLHSERQAWDRPARECTLVCCLLLGPVYLVISAELLLFAVIGEGLIHDKLRHYKDS